MKKRRTKNTRVIGLVVIAQMGFIICFILLFAGVRKVSALTITENNTVIQNQVINEDLTLEGASHCTIRNNIIHGQLSISEFSEHNTISDNTVDELIYIYESAYNTLRGNNMGGFLTGSEGSGTSPTYRYDQDIDTSNLVKGKPLYFYFNIHDTVIEDLTDIGQLYMVVSSGVTIRGLNMDTAGIVLKACPNCVITDCVVDFTSDSNVHKVGFIGIILDNCGHSTVENCDITISGDCGWGIFGDTAPYSEFSNNTISVYTTGWNTKGFHIYASNDVEVTKCTITATRNGKPALSIAYPYNNGLFYITSNVINGLTQVSGVAGADGDVYYINTTFESLSVSDRWTAYRLWYLDVKVIDSTGDSIEGATVIAKDKNNNESFSDNTGADGYITRQTLLEYEQTKDEKTNSIPYTITASKGGLTATLSGLDIDETWYREVPDTPLKTVVLNLDTGTGWVESAAVGIVSGTVTDNESNPIEGATVTVEGTGLSCNTASDGTYTRENVPVGTYTVTASKSGYQPSSKENVIVSEGATITADFQLEPSEDTTPPIITLKTIMVNGSVDDATVTEVEINGTSVVVASGAYSHEVDVSSTSTITIVAINGDNKTVTRTINIQ